MAPYGGLPHVCEPSKVPLLCRVMLLVSCPRITAPLPSDDVCILISGLQNTTAAKITDRIAGKIILAIKAGVLKVSQPVQAIMSGRCDV